MKRQFLDTDANRTQHGKVLLSAILIVLVSASVLGSGAGATVTNRSTTKVGSAVSPAASLRSIPRKTLNRFQPGSLCYRGEVIVFSAAVSGNRKLVSICGSANLDETEGYLQYRFGRPGKMELEFPRRREETQCQFRYSRYTRPLLTYLAVRFETGDYLYSIHQNYAADVKPALKEASITVTPIESLSDPKPVKIRLQMPFKGDLMKLEDVVRRSDEEPAFP